jgi:hypothetical protein
MDNRPQRSPDFRDTPSEAIAAKLAARRRRVRAIRTRVAGLSVATLMATSGVVVVQLVTGNDPALAKAHTSSDVTSVAHATTGTTASTGTTTSDPRTTTSRTRAHTTRRRASSSSKRAASTPTTVKTSAS